jgi:hypothetical protein
MKRGDMIRVLQMEDYNGIDIQAAKMNGNIYIVDYVDDAGQIHLQESGLAIIPEVDKYILMDNITEFDKEVSEIYDIVSEYLHKNDYIEDDDGLYLDKDYKIHLTTYPIVTRLGIESFVPIKDLTREVLDKVVPDVVKIEEMVSVYIEKEL